MIDRYFSLGYFYTNSQIDLLYIDYTNIIHMLPIFNLINLVDNYFGLLFLFFVVLFLEVGHFLDQYVEYY